DNRANLPRAELRNEELGTVGEQQGNAVLALDPERRKRRSADVAQLVELAEGQPGALEEDGRVVRLLSRGVGEIVEKSAVRVRRERRRDAVIVVRQPRRAHVRLQTVYREPVLIRNDPSSKRSRYAP